jgi:hypothetical protein
MLLYGCIRQSSFFYHAIENIPIYQQKWEIYFGVELPWEEIWGRHFKNLANRTSKQLQWKVIHRIITPYFFPW